MAQNWIPTEQEKYHMLNIIHKNEFQSIKKLQHKIKHCYLIISLQYYTEL